MKYMKEMASKIFYGSIKQTTVELDISRESVSWILVEILSLRFVFAGLLSYHEQVFLAVRFLIHVHGAPNNIYFNYQY